MSENPEKTGEYGALPVADTDLFDRSFQRNPFPVYARLREKCPLLKERTYDNFVLTRYADVQRLIDTDWLSAVDGVDPAGRFSASTFPDIERTDPPRHRRLRALLTQSLSPKMVRAWTADVTAIFVQHFDAIQGEVFDIVDAVCYPAPAAVMCAIMGFPESLRADYRKWSNALMSRLGRDIEAEQRDLLIEMARFIRRSAAERQARRGDDLLSELVHGEIDGERLSENEVVAHGVFLLAAGHETTTNLLGSLVQALIEQPALFAELRRDRSKVRTLIEETLRLEAPIQAICRTTRKPFVIHGTEIPDDARVMFTLGSAGRDPEVFEQADSLRFDRPASPRHMAFGYGDHACLGARLARLEADIFVNAMLDRYEIIEAAGTPERWESTVVRGFHHLPVRAVARRSE